MSIEIQDYWWFQRLDDVIWDLASDPDTVLTRNRGIPFPDDVAVDFDHFYRLIVNKYRDKLDQGYVRRIIDIQDKLGSITGWTDKEFRDSEGWGNIRKLAAEYCLLNKKLA